jgi:AcrR family transcriptional regulator
MSLGECIYPGKATARRKSRRVGEAPHHLPAHSSELTLSRARYSLGASGLRVGKARGEPYVAARIHRDHGLPNSCTTALIHSRPVPRYVNHEERRRDIIEATERVLAERGMKGLSFRNVAARLGGSTTLITHFYATQEQLLTDVARRLTGEWEQDVRELDAEFDDPWERLRALLIWLVPITEDDRISERARIQLLADQLTGAEHREVFERWERKMRQFLRNHVREIVPADRVAEVVDLLRAATSGVVLSTLEHPREWPAERQVAVVDHLLETVAAAST